MAAVTSAVTSAVIGVASAGYQIYNAEKQKSDAKKAINNFQRQDLDNPYKDIQISTVKSEQQTEANNVNFATSVDALQRGGTRAVITGIPRINQQNILLQNIISADLDRQDKERQRLIARGEENIRAIRENRETRALGGLGQQLQTASQDSASGVSNLVSTGLSLGSELITSPTVNRDTTTPNTSESLNTIDTSGFDSFDFSSDNASLFDNTNSALA